MIDIGYQWLEDVEVQPVRECVCCALKSLAKNRQDARTLWKAVLQRQPNSFEVSRPLVHSIWKDLVDSGCVTGYPEPSAAEVELKELRDKIVQEYKEQNLVGMPPIVKSTSIGKQYYRSTGVAHF